MPIEVKKQPPGVNTGTIRAVGEFAQLFRDRLAGPDALSRVRRNNASGKPGDGSVAAGQTNSVKTEAPLPPDLKPVSTPAK